MSEETTTKKQDYLNRIYEWRKKNSDCMMSSEEIDAIFARDKEDLLTDVPNIFEDDD